MLHTVAFVALVATVIAADPKDFLKSLVGKSTFPWDEFCKAMDESASGYSSDGDTYNVQCGPGKSYKITCLGSPFTCCSTPSIDHVCKDCADEAWSCPASWSTSESPEIPDDAPDAKAFIAANNVYRCMHDVRAVQWDDEVHASAKIWAQQTGKTMEHAKKDSSLPKSDGENLAGTSAYSKHRGVDATHMWYAEIKSACHWGTSCFQSFTAGHFTAMIWKSVSKIAYSDTTQKVAVGRYRGCNNDAPNYANKYKSMVPPPVHNWATCAAKVAKCDAFADIKFDVKAHGVDGVEGCDGSGKGESDADGMMVWHESYATSCKAKYASIVDDIVQRYDIPEVLAPLMANPWLAAVSGLVLVTGVVMIARRRSPRVGREFPQLVPAEVDEELIAVEVEEPNPE